VQTTINQRIKFLLESLDMSARSFGRAIGVAENSTQNYLEPRLAMPKADYLEKVVLHFGSINSHWLLTGQGEAFTSNAVPQSGNYQKLEKNKGNVVGVNHGIASQQGTDANLERELAAAQHTIALLTSQLQDKERIIQLYERQPSPPK
jgi:hypothetical protein